MHSRKGRKRKAVCGKASLLLYAAVSHADDGKSFRWDIGLPTLSYPQWYHAHMGKRDRSLSHRGGTDTLSRYASGRRHHKVERGDAAARGYHLWRQPMSGSQRSRSEGWSCRRTLRTLYGAMPDREGDERCRY